MNFDLKKQWPLLGIPWTLLLMVRMLPDLISWGVIADSHFFCFGPFACLLVVFALCRVGAIFGFVVLTIASYCALPWGSADTRDMATGVAFVVILLGGPASLFVGLVERFAKYVLSKEN